MSRRKHVLQDAVHGMVEPPGQGQHIVQVAGTRGGNIVQVLYPDGTKTLVMMPSKFNKKLWVRRGGHVVVEAAEDAGASKVTGTIVAVLYADHVKQLKKMGAWPAECPGWDSPQLEAGGTSQRQQEQEELGGQEGRGGGDGVEAPDDSDGEEDDGLPPLEANNNRKIIVHYVSDDEAEGEDGSDEG